MILEDNQYEIELDISDIKNIIVYVKYLYKTFKTVLPKNLERHGFKKYNLALKLYNLIIFNTYKMEYIENVGIMLIFSNVIFEPDNKIYNGDIIVSLEEYVNYDGYNLATIVNNLESIDLETSKKLIILNHNHIGILERKIELLEEKIEELNHESYYNY
jgi:hypothetical protein